ncbi:MAG: hypothetical protein GQ542_12935 [Desulforhopalus sp.]|nr:hypothetical protein [Desulforhopalus sp.]
MVIGYGNLSTEEITDGIAIPADHFEHDLSDCRKKMIKSIDFSGTF